MANRTGEQWFAQYAADNASPWLHELFASNPKLVLFAAPYLFGRQDKRYCVVEIGITHAALRANVPPRLAANQFFAAATGFDATSVEGESGCYGVALKRAFSELNDLGPDDVENVKARLAMTRYEPGQRAANQPPAPTRLNSTRLGVNDVAAKWLVDSFPAWFMRAFDYRSVSVREVFRVLAADNGNQVCFALLGVTATAAPDRNPRFPVTQDTSARIVAAENTASAKRDDVCFDPLFERIIRESIRPDSVFIRDLHAGWGQVNEPGAVLPSRDQVRKAVAEDERMRKQREAKPSAQRSTQVTRSANSCTVECVNGSCIRRWANGKSERFQAPRKFNPFTSQWEWDTSGC